MRPEGPAHPASCCLGFWCSASGHQAGKGLESSARGSGWAQTPLLFTSISSETPWSDLGHNGGLTKPPACKKLPGWATAKGEK